MQHRTAVNIIVGSYSCTSMVIGVRLYAYTGKRFSQSRWKTGFLLWSVHRLCDSTDGDTHTQFVKGGFGIPVINTCSGQYIWNQFENP